MKKEINSTADLNREDTVRLILDFFHRTMMHHAMWYAEVERQLGREKAMETLKTAYEKSSAIQLKRLSKVLGFEMKEDIPGPLLDLPDDTLQKLKEAAAANWLANDGVWFQAVEFSKDMTEAKKCNDACWGAFSPFEAWSIRRFLDIPANPGLEGLKKALYFRLYSVINKQSIVEETPTSFVFHMDECRVQAARKRKGLDDYPCKSAGVVEYSTFAAAIDPRIKTECIACPPDEHPEEWFCSWRFSI
ncbi:MAG: cytosolic protein [Candidatus Aminicenantes bacterium]|nr:cytosolic protein [Candidatus Aminicenantes bacterium]